jgi:hypothetical protein
MKLSKTFEASILVAALALSACGSRTTNQSASPEKNQEKTSDTDKKQNQSGNTDGDAAGTKQSYPFLKASSDDELVAAPAGKSSYFLQYKNPGNKNTCYLLPNPDGTAVEQKLCNGSDKAIIAKLEANGFCGKTVASEGEQAAGLRNEMPCDTATEIRTELEKHLIFGHEGLHLYHEDLLVACAQTACKDSSVTAEICEETKDIQEKVAKNEPVTLLARIYSEEVLDAVGACAAAVYSK